MRSATRATLRGPGLRRTPRVEGLPAALVPSFPRRTLTVMTGTVQ